VEVSLFLSCILGDTIITGCNLTSSPGYIMFIINRIFHLVQTYLFSLELSTSYIIKLGSILWAIPGYVGILSSDNEAQFVE